jgi:hypothetical protein
LFWFTILAQHETDDVILYIYSIHKHKHRGNSFKLQNYKMRLKQIRLNWINSGGIRRFCFDLATLRIFKFDHWYWDWKYNKGNAKHDVSPRLKIRPLWPWPLTMKINTVPDSLKDYACTKFDRNPLIQSSLYRVVTSAWPCNKVGHLFWFTILAQHETDDVILYIYSIHKHKHRGNSIYIWYYENFQLQLV